MKIFTAAQIREWDKYTGSVELVTSLHLMERAAIACFKWLQKNTSSKHFTIFCGSGNNGGDGLVIARLLHKAKYTVEVYMLNSDKRTTENALNLKRLSSLKVKRAFISTAKDFPNIAKDTIVIDAIYGTGLDGPLKNIAAQLVDHINQQAATVVSIDMPSGLIADKYSGEEAIIKATHTLSFEINKLAFILAADAGYMGEVHLLNINLSGKYYETTPANFETIDEPLINKIYKPRNPFAHKYHFGHALLYAGSNKMMGAGILCTKACLRAGAGLATIQLPAGASAIINVSVPEAITSSTNDTAKSWLKKTAIAVGPGLELSAKNKQLVKKLLSGWQGPLVIDATGLSLLAPNMGLLPLRKLHPAILTPHTGEFEKLFGKTSNPFERLQLAMEKAVTLKCYIVLKGRHTLIAGPDGYGYFNSNGNAGMATAGSGDVLTGILGGLLAQGYREKEACILGVYLHGLAGDIAAEKLSQEAMIAHDIIDYLGAAFKQIKK
jgi:NAD(P)H-hydrate epimerase